MDDSALAAGRRVLEHRHDRTDADRRLANVNPLVAERTGQAEGGHVRCNTAGCGLVRLLGVFFGNRNDEPTRLSRSANTELEGLFPDPSRCRRGLASLLPIRPAPTQGAPLPYRSKRTLASQSFVREITDLRSVLSVGANDAPASSRRGEYAPDDHARVGLSRPTRAVRRRANASA